MSKFVKTVHIVKMLFRSCFYVTLNKCLKVTGLKGCSFCSKIKKFVSESMNEWVSDLQGHRQLQKKEEEEGFFATSNKMIFHTEKISHRPWPQGSIAPHFLRSYSGLVGTLHTWPALQNNQWYVAIKHCHKRNVTRYHFLYNL